MTEEDTQHNHDTVEHDEQHQLLASGSRDGSPDPDIIARPLPPPIQPPVRRQSSFARNRPNGTQRTPNRVRFEEPERLAEGEHDDQAKDGDDDWLDLEEEDYMNSNGDGRGARGGYGQRAPLLTGITAPSVTVASEEFDFNPEDLLESARPKSGMGSAFMNMANSIM